MLKRDDLPQSSRACAEMDFGVRIMEITSSASVESCTAEAPAAESQPSSSPTSQRAASLSEILVQVRAQCSQPRLPAKFSFFGVRPSLCSLPCTPAEFLRLLLKNFRADELAAAGVAATNNDGQLKLSPILGNAQGSTFVMRLTPDNTPVDVVSTRGVLTAIGDDWDRLAQEVTKDNN